MISPFYPEGLPVALSLVGYNALIIGLFIGFKRKDRIGFCYAVLSLMVFGWGIGLSFMFNNALPGGTARFWGKVAQVCFFLMPVTWLHFILAYTQRIKTEFKNLILCYAVTFLFLILTPSALFIPDFRERIGLLHIPVAGPAYKALTILYFVVLVYSFWEFFDSWKKETSELRRSDYRFLFLAQLYGYGLCSLSLLLSYGLLVPPFYLFALPLWQFFLAYAMVRHHLLDYETLEKAMRRDKLAALSTLTAGMYHELRNPLTAIKTFAEYLPQKYDQPEFRNQFKETVTEEVKRIDQLLRELLDFSKPDKDQFNPEKVDSVLDETLQFLKHNLETHKIAVEKSYHGDSVLMMDRNQMKQAFLNIILNSIQAMPEGGTLAVSTAETQRGDFKITILDTGIGISNWPFAHFKD